MPGRLAIRGKREPRGPGRPGRRVARSGGMRVEDTELVLGLHEAGACELVRPR